MPLDEANTTGDLGHVDSDAYAKVTLGLETDRRHQGQGRW